MRWLANITLIIIILTSGFISYNSVRRVMDGFQMTYEVYVESQKGRIELEGISETKIRSEYRDLEDIYVEIIIPREKYIATTAGILLGVSVLSLFAINYKLVFRKKK